MKRLSTDELREMYLSFFVEKGHKRLPGASLIPHGDPTMLLTSAGMVPFKPYFLGLEKPPQRRITTCQRCLRTPDIDNVGHTDRHATFFEMLGNFSFGDYFKKEAIEWAWEFVTERLELDKDKLWVSIYHEDDEAFDIWHEVIGLPKDRIVRLGRKDNFWEIGVGPCGPCSEIFVDRGEGCGHPDCKPGCSRCERFFEIWNLVFIQYDQDAEGNLHPLEQKGIDTGMGLERTAAFLQGVSSIFEIDTMRPIVDYIAERAGTRYGADPEKDVSLRVITDHMRGVTFLVYDGVLPGNEGRGYVLRRLLRRAARHARLLEIDGPFLASVAERVAQQMASEYPEVQAELPRIQKVIAREEGRFRQTLDQGVELLTGLIEKLQAEGKSELPGEDAFRLHDTYGFPFELTEEIARGHGVTVDRAGFDAAMEQQRARARAARAKTGYLGDEGLSHWLDLDLPETEFVGYDRLEAEATVAMLVVDGEPVEHVSSADAAVYIVLDRTPFYAEGGGQVSDTGTITTAGGQLLVEDVERVGEGRFIHRAKLSSGIVRVGEKALATVDAQRRRDTARHHTGTHLLHKALHEIIGSHATQAGSLVAPDRLRFDFTHFEPLTPEERKRIEQRVNEQIMAALPVTATVTSRTEAERMGAVALFGEKYGERVRVVSIGDYSKELCGGTHVERTSDLGVFKIVSESSVASGVRRIEAVAGYHALRYIDEAESILSDVAQRLQVSPADVPAHVDRLAAQVKNLERELARLRDKIHAAAGSELAAQAIEVDGIKVLAAKVEAADMPSLRNVGDMLRERLKECALVLGAAADGKVFLVAMATPGAQARGLKANELVRQIAPVVGGGGGGNPSMAQAGGKAPEKLDEAIARARALLQGQLTG